MVCPTCGTDLKPQPARIIFTGRGREVRSPKNNHLLGIINDQNQLIIKCDDELVIVEVPAT